MDENVDQADGVSRTRLIYTDNKFRVAVFVKEQKQKKKYETVSNKNSNFLIFYKRVLLCVGV